MDDDFRPRPYPPSVLAGGAVLVAVLAAIVVSVLMVSAASVDGPHLSRDARTSRPAPTAPAFPAAPSAPTVAGETATQTSFEGFLDRLIPQFPALDRLTQPAP
ncbi:hypothetical protein BayCH28_20220 [Mycolicibacterium sp. CH28]|uniref:hypothetical protein n=1 Tax=Mycolicibacterium sp. CH28 TaxID=2512237 RepID=UPI001082173C|nr:hypothetical protein [Mycolicibacterium sp. CH28]TGD85369.1 hypothetical protein BayCH28_20220 [Mycolicibacterium sp. CH28]